MTAGAGTRRPSTLLFRIVVTGAILLYLGLRLDWAGMASEMARSDPTKMLVACCAMGIAFLAGSVRWWCLLRVQGIALPLGLVIRLVFVGLFFNLFLFGAIGGDVLKALYAMKYAPEKRARAALSIVADRVLGMVTFLCVIFVLVPWQFQFLMQSGEARAVAYAFGVALAAAALIVVSLAFIPLRAMPEAVRRLWERIPNKHVLASLREGLKQHGRALPLTLGATGSSVVVVAITSLAGWFIASAIHIDVSFLQIAVILAFVICITSLPISIGGHGVREGAFVLMFAAFGIAAADGATSSRQEFAVLFSIAYFAMHLFWGVVGGLIYLGFQNAGFQNENNS